MVIGRLDAVDALRQFTVPCGSFPMRLPLYMYQLASQNFQFIAKKEGGLWFFADFLLSLYSFPSSSPFPPPPFSAPPAAPPGCWSRQFFANNSTRAGETQHFLGPRRVFHGQAYIRIGPHEMVLAEGLEVQVVDRDPATYSGPTMRVEP